MKKTNYFIVCLFGMLLSTTTFAQQLQPAQIKQVSNDNLSTGQPIVAAGNQFFFVVYSPNGNVLWKSNGTSTGTTIIKQINPIGQNSSNSFLNELNGEIFFDHNDSLWKTDGNNIVMVDPNEPMKYPQFLTKSNGFLYYIAWNNNDGYELWKTDGTPAGTGLVKNINTSSGSEPRYLTDVNNTLFFTANDGINGYELWKSDGTDAGTVLVKDDIDPTNISMPKDFINVNGTLFFLADDGVNGYELWKSDGTKSGTVIVKDIKPGQESSTIQHMVNVNGTLYFMANSDLSAEAALWKSDGTAAGTVMVKDLAAENMYGAKYLTNVNGTLYFGAFEFKKWFLCKSDGTSSGTVIVKKENADGSPTNLVNYNGKLYFTAVDSVKGFEIWRSDGTETGTYTISDFTTEYHFHSFQEINNKLYFYMIDSTDRLNLFTLEQTTGITEKLSKNEPGINVYPNPASENIKISVPSTLNSKIELEIFNISGKKVFNKSGVLNGEKINILNLPNGLYLVETKSGNEVLKRGKFVISR